jgi:eukaryotic-like serine/threonine-protein kinase
VPIAIPGAPRVFQPGDVFRDHYVVEGFLGEGASGQVYAIRHRFTQRRFALKVGHLADRGNASKVARSLAEARATYILSHRNVVVVEDLACEADGMVWQRMELLDGSSIAALLDRYGAFSPITAIDIVIHAAWGLQAAHENLIVHRDVKPSNVFVTAAGEIKVLDFSLAKVRFLDLETTRGRHPKGTVAYMSPEHISGADATPQFDVFGVGIMLWEMLVGRLPYDDRPEATPFEDVRRQLQEEPASLVTAAGLPGYCEDVVRAAIAKDPARRYEGMWALVQALSGLRARLLADPAMALRVQHPPDWERRLGVARDHEGYQQYRAPRSLPRESPEPGFPSRRIVVSPAASPGAVAKLPDVAATVRMPVAVTVPMQVMEEGTSPGPRSLVDPAAPTVRGRPARTRRRLRVVAGVVTVLGVLGVGIGLLAAYDLIPLPTSSAVGPGPSARSDPRLPPALPPKR